MTAWRWPRMARSCWRWRWSGVTNGRALGRCAPLYHRTTSATRIRAAARLAKPRSGHVGTDLQGRNSAAGKGLSLLTRGRLSLAVPASRSGVRRRMAAFIGLLSAGSVRERVTQPSAQTVVDLPAGDLAAPVEDEGEGEERPQCRARQPGDPLAPELARTGGAVGGGRSGRARCPGASASTSLTPFAPHLVHGCVRTDMLPAIGPPRPDLTGVRGGQAQPGCPVPWTGQNAERLANPGAWQVARRRSRSAARRRLAGAGGTAVGRARRGPTRPARSSAARCARSGPARH
jgi:hypothetical protein